MRKQLSLFDPVEDSKNVSSTEIVEDGKRQAIQRYLDRVQAEPTASVGTYSPNGRKTEYYRLLYRIGKSVKAIHIRGGNVHSKLAQYRAQQLQVMIDRGAELNELIAAVGTFNSGKK
ncbi:MAG: hypothetical protein AAFQ41_03130 [Cyanobacteria bacterium J06623_7]